MYNSVNNSIPSGLNLYEIYHVALHSGLMVMVVYAAISLYTINPKGREYRGYIIAQRIFGILMYIWAGYMYLHARLHLRFNDNYMAMTVSLTSYFLLTCGFELLIHTVMDSNYFSWRRIRTSLLLCGAYDLALGLNFLFMPDRWRNHAILLLVIPLFIKGCVTIYRIATKYISLKSSVDNYFSDNTSDAVKWIRNCIFILIGLGVVGLVAPYGTALTDTISTYLTIMILTYIMMSFKSYLVSVVTVEQAVQRERESCAVKGENEENNTKLYIVKRQLDAWVKELKFIQMGITIEDVAKEIKSNRTYISEYLNGTLNLTFRNWIALLKVEHAKKLLRDNPEYTTIKVAVLVGFSRSSFSQAFTKLTGETPSSWKRKHVKSEERA